MFFYNFLSLSCWAILLVSCFQCKNKKAKEMPFNPQIEDDKNIKCAAEDYDDELRSLVTTIKNKIYSNQNIEEQYKLLTGFHEAIIADMPFANALLCRKKQICLELNIELVLDINKIPDIISEKEMVSLLGNLIDNAIEAASKCDDRRITISSHVVKGQWIIKVANSKLPQLHPLDNGMTTTKADHINHGIGNRIIKRIVNTNKGVLREHDSGDMFEVFITMPV